MDDTLKTQEIDALRKSYYNLLAHFIQGSSVKEGFIDGLFKWGVQLNISKKEIYNLIGNPDLISFQEPKDKHEAIRWVYDLVYMIYLDGKVEDIELEITTEYAKKLGFEPYIVNDLLKAIVTAPYDGIGDEDVRQEIKTIVDDSLMGK